MRIRTVKPEWLDDEALVLASADARVLSIALILLADDYGNGRANVAVLSGRVFPGKVPETLANALAELAKARFVVLYEADGQRYFSIRNWSKHQKVDKPGKPQVPGFTDFAKAIEAPENIRETLATDQDQEGTRKRPGADLAGARACESAPRRDKSPDATRGERIRKGYLERFAKATPIKPPAQAQPGSGGPWLDLARDLTDEQCGPFLDAYFADDWCKGGGFKLGALASERVRLLTTGPTVAGQAAPLSLVRSASPELVAALEAQERAEEACRKARLHRDSVAGTEAHSEASRAHSAKQRELAMAKDRVEALSA